MNSAMTARSIQMKSCLIKRTPHNAIGDQHNQALCGDELLWLIPPATRGEVVMHALLARLVGTAGTKPLEC